MQRFTRAALFFALTLTGLNAWAIKDPETGVVFSDTTKCMGATGKAAGAGVREATMGIDVYAVVVYVGPAGLGKSIRATGACVKISARFVRNVDADKVKGAWVKSLKKYGATGAKAKKFLAIITGEIKKRQKMVMTTKGGTVVFKYAGKKVKITGAAKLASAIKKTYLGSGSPTPTLIKDVRKRGVAKP